jgi:hypothetical protein
MLFQHFYLLLFIVVDVLTKREAKSGKSSIKKYFLQILEIGLCTFKNKLINYFYFANSAKALRYLPDMSAPDEEADRFAVNFYHRVHKEGTKGTEVLGKENGGKS